MWGRVIYSNTVVAMCRCDVGVGCNVGVRVRDVLVCDRARWCVRGVLVCDQARWCVRGVWVTHDSNLFCFVCLYLYV